MTGQDRNSRTRFLSSNTHPVLSDEVFASSEQAEKDAYLMYGATIESQHVQMPGRKLRSEVFTLPGSFVHISPHEFKAHK